ncbi:CUB domain protein, partial [Opisthorchis viverrini]
NPLYISEPKCGSELPDNEGSFQSPGYPIIYPDNLNCTWTIKRPQKASVLKFRDFEVEAPLWGGSCTFDYVLVIVGSGDSAVTHDPLCGYIPPADITFDDEVTIKFISDRIRAYKGFVASYFPDPCVHDLQVESGEIKSPEYPHDYPNDLGCSWTIKRPSKPGVLTFEDFDVESANWGERCQFDYLYVFVGTGRSVTSYGPYCGTEKPENIVYNDTVQVTSTTDGDGTHRGFKLTFG